MDNFYLTIPQAESLSRLLIKWVWEVSLPERSRGLFLGHNIRLSWLGKTIQVEILEDGDNGYIVH